MEWSLCLLFCSTISTVRAINRPVYKVGLTQKGYAQFLQYDVETPSLKEFTFCTWVKFKEIDGNQTIFSYLVFGGAVGVKLWMVSGGRNINVVIKSNTGSVSSSLPVEIEKETWRHVCLSFQSDYGAWAFYLDSQLVACESSKRVYDSVLPSGGSVVIGYGTDDDGASNGIEGELYGANMILVSTIGKNKTVFRKATPKIQFSQKNKFKENSNSKQYVVLKDIKDATTPENFKKNRSFIRLTTPHSFIEHDVGIDINNNKKVAELTKEKDDFDTSEPRPLKKDIQFWGLVNKAGQSGKFKTQQKSSGEQSGSGTEDLIAVSEYEKPPPPGPAAVEYFDKGLEIPKPPTFNINNNVMPTKPKLSDIETPPPPTVNTNVYGQWTNNKFANNVLDFLKKNNLYYKDHRKVPQTIPLIKISDVFPYASNIREYKVRPSFQFVANNLFSKRNGKQRNLQIVEYDLRNAILKSHSQTKPKLVEIMPRGQGQISPENRFYREIQNQDMEINDSDDVTKSYSEINDINGLNLFLNNLGSSEISDTHEKKNHKRTTDLNFRKVNEASVFSLKNPVNTYDNNSEKIESVYLKSMSNFRNWHNIKQFGDSFAPRYINMELNFNKSITNNVINDKKARKISGDAYFIQDSRRKYIRFPKEEEIQKGIELAADITHETTKKELPPLQVYNHRLQGSRDKNYKNRDSKGDNYTHKNNFNKKVKIGNALNERDVLGSSEEQKQKSFIGGDESIPDIHKYRSDIDNENSNVPSSLGPKICKKDMEQNSVEQILFVLPDGSIDTVPIFTTLSEKKNIGIEFIQENYRKCSWEQSLLGNSTLLIINWNETPVRLFGGAQPKKTTDLCGFF